MRWWWLVFAAFGCSGRERQCSNGEDDDADGFVDCADQDCADTCGESCANFRDDDGDGAVDCLDPDCAAVCPILREGTEVCDNGLDDDGDWLFDCDDPDCDRTCDVDADGHVATAFGGFDCDDNNANVYPGATEVPYDGVDGDCDPATPDDDLDGDGFGVAADCDDSAPATFPGAPEVCGDQHSNDCSRPGVTVPRSACFGPRPASTSDAVFLGTSADDWTGSALAAAGDVNGDGFADFIVGAYGQGNDATGAVYLVPGPATGVQDLALAQAKWTGESEDDWAGFAVAGGADLTGDGRLNVVIGARYDDATGNNAGATYVVHGFDTGTVDLANIVGKVFAEAEYDSSGYSVAIPGDVDGDGQADLLIGSPENARVANSAGMVHLVFGPVRGPVQLVTADYRLVGEREGDRLGCAVTGAGDLDGDGQRDLLVGACASDRNGLDAGAAFQFSTHPRADRSVTEAEGAMVGERALDQLGTALAAGDLDGDGRSDVVVGAPLHDFAGEDSGAVYVARGPATVAMNQPDAKLVGDGAGDRFGTSVAVVGDVDGDTLDDLLVGAPGRDDGGEDAGAAYLFFGPVFGPRTAGDADVIVQGTAPFDFLGAAVSGAGDVDGDGYIDLLIGAPFTDGLAPSAGSVHLFTFGW